MLLHCRGSEDLFMVDLKINKKTNKSKYFRYPYFIKIILLYNEKIMNDNFPIKLAITKTSQQKIAISRWHMAIFLLKV